MRGEFVVFYIDIYIYIFKISLNVSRNFGIKNSSDRTEICKISYNFLTVATIWVVMIIKIIWASNILTK